MKISHRLMLLVVITGIGYLGLTLTFNRLFTETLDKNQLLTELQSLHNNLKLIRLEIKHSASQNGLETTVRNFTNDSVVTLENIAAKLPHSLVPLANNIASSLAEFGSDFTASRQHFNNINNLRHHFRQHAKQISQDIIKQCDTLAADIPNNPKVSHNFIQLQAINNLVNNYSNLTLEALFINNNRPTFVANKYLFTENIADRISQISNSLDADTVKSLHNQISSWIELSQRLSTELQQFNDAKLKIAISEEKLTKSLITLENGLKVHIREKMQHLSNDYKTATVGLFLIMLFTTALISRSIFVPLKRLLWFSKQLTDGNYQAQLIGLPHGEFQEISQAFNTMVTTIKESQSQLENKVHVRTQQLQESNRTLTEEIYARKQVERLLNEIGTSVLARTGSQYFSSFTQFLTTKLDFDFAFIGQLNQDREQLSITTLSFSEQGVELPNLTFVLKGTPCEKVVNDQRYFFPAKVAHQFPDDDFMVENQIESYVGVPIFDNQQNPLGLVSVLSRSPMESPEPASSILKIFVGQVGAEIIRSRQDLALRISEERNRILVDYAPEAITILDATAQRFISANKNATKLFELSEERLLEHSPVDLSPEKQPNGLDSATAAQRQIESAINGHHPVFEWQHKNARGELIDCEVRLAKLPSEHGILVRGSITNISERKKTEAQMRKLSSALAQAGDAAMVTDREGNIEYVNQACVQITGFEQQELIGRTPRVLKSERMDKGFYQRLWETVLAGKPFSDIFINRHKNGSIYYEEKTITPLTNTSGEITHFISTGKDITERIQTEERLHHLAYHDPLTDLPNRLLLMERIEHAIHNAQRHQQRLAVMFLDLDRFKNINDTLGHNVGDSLLKQIATRIQDSLRSNDTFARLGGDEFAILVESLSDSNEIASVAEKVIANFKTPIYVQDHELFTTVSIGISLFPENGQDATTLVKNADVAMYRAKEQGRDCYQFYSTELTTKAYERLSIENKLRRALENGEFELFYQPQILSPTNIVYGLEALLRWRDPERGLISPAGFIPVLEETGMIIPVGEWVLETACDDLKLWQQQSNLPVVIAVNLSSKQFEDPTLPKKVLNTLKQRQFDPKLLKLEITESALMIDPGRTARILRELTASGIRIAVDDFGTGYSSLSYLKQFPIHILKIDRSFIQDITVDPDDAAIVSAIIAMADSLSLDVIAEGVETFTQVKYLEQLSCEKIQGFLFAKPMSRDECFKLLKDRQGILDPNQEDPQE